MTSSAEELALANAFWTCSETLSYLAPKYLETIAMTGTATNVTVLSFHDNLIMKKRIPIIRTTLRVKILNRKPMPSPIFVQSLVNLDVSSPVFLTSKKPISMEVKHENNLY